MSTRQPASFNDLVNELHIEAEKIEQNSPFNGEIQTYIPANIFDVVSENDFINRFIESQAIATNTQLAKTMTMRIKGNARKIFTISLYSRTSSTFTRAMLSATSLVDESLPFRADQRLSTFTTADFDRFLSYQHRFMRPVTLHHATFDRVLITDQIVPLNYDIALARLGSRDTSSGAVYRATLSDGHHDFGALRNKEIAVKVISKANSATREIEVLKAIAENIRPMSSNIATSYGAFQRGGDTYVLLELATSDLDFFHEKQPWQQLQQELAALAASWPCTSAS
jgi:hypothetical protein